MPVSADYRAEKVPAKMVVDVFIFIFLVFCHRVAPEGAFLDVQHISAQMPVSADNRLTPKTRCFAFYVQE